MDIDTNVSVNSFNNMSFPDPLNGINTPLDQNSPILFKRNLELVQREVVRVQSLAQEVLSGIGGAYCAGMEPMNTKRTCLPPNRPYLDSPTLR
jgi:hypothetical protein